MIECVLTTYTVDSDTLHSSVLHDAHVIRVSEFSVYSVAFVDKCVLTPCAADDDVQVIRVSECPVYSRAFDDVECVLTP